MIKWKCGLLIALAPAGMTGVPCLAQGQPGQYEMRTEKQQAKRLAKMTMLKVEGVANAVTVSDDPFESAVILSSSAVFPSPRSFTDRVLGENFIRVFVDRKTGKAAFQLYQSVSYLGDWRRFEQVNIMFPEGLRTKSLTRIDDKMRDCYAVNFCGREETLGFDLSEEDMEAIAAMKPEANGAPALLRFRFKSNASFDWTDDISPIEAAGVLVALKRWREAKGL